MRRMMFSLLMGISCILGSTIHGENLRYTIHDTGTLATEQSFSSGINNLNTVVGRVKLEGTWHDFVYEQQKGLQVLPYQTSIRQNPLINNLGQMVGVHWKESIEKHWFSSDTITRSKHIYLREADGSSQDISLPDNWNIQILEDWQTPSAWDHYEVRVIDFNDLGQILVAHTKKDGTILESALWKKGHFEKIDSGVLPNAYKINNQGMILGRQYVKKAETNTAIPMLVLYDPISQTAEQIIQDVNVKHVDLNDQGQTVIFRASPKEIEGYLWDREKGLASLNGFAPLFINNLGQIAGARLSENGVVSILRNEGEETNLNDAAGIGDIESPWNTIQEIAGLNDGGGICGASKMCGEQKHAFLLIPEESHL